MPWSSPRDPIVDVAVKACGGAAALARALGISRVAVGNWRRIPPLRVRAVSELSGIAMRKLRPDLYR